MKPGEYSENLLRSSIEAIRRLKVFQRRGTWVVVVAHTIIYDVAGSRAKGRVLETFV
jgi:hypothetical protein